MTKNQLITAYFDDFVELFPTFDGDRIATKFTTPLMVKGTGFAPKILSTRRDIASYFQVYLDKYKEIGYVSCLYTNLDVKWLGNDNALASLDWSMVDSSDVVKTKWTESYLMSVSENEAISYGTVDHDLSIE